MTRPLLLFAAVLPALALPACSGTKNRGLESVHQPVVTRTDYALDVSAGPAGLAPGEGQRLAGWMGALRVGYGDRVLVDDAGYASAIRADVQRVAARFGLLVADEAPVASAPLAPDTARVVVVRARAEVPSCPDYSLVSQPDFESNTSSNFGCGINSNIAAMVANPTDLVRGQGNADVYDPAVGTRAIDAFRKAAPSGAGGTAVKSESAGGK